MEHLTIYLAGIISFFVTVFTTPLTLKIVKKLKIYDDPKTHKHPAIIHKTPIPRGGGIPLFLGIWVAAVFFLPMTQTTIALFVASLLALGIGVVDDKLDVSPYLRFFINILTAGIVVASGITISFVTNPLGGILHFTKLPFTLPILATNGTLIATGVAIVWIVWVMNMLNWSKGVDGQMPGIVAISATIIGLLSLRFPLTDPHTFTAAFLSFAIAGSCLGFLLFNFYPAKIFPGYGATSMYLILAAVSILSGAKLATAILVMGIPMIDGMVTIIRRIASGHSPFWHDNKHLHHLLLRLGLDQRTIALSYWIVSAILGIISLTLSSREKLFAIIMVLIVVGGAILFLHIFLENTNEKKTV